jgi:hypothetical protein
MTGIFARQGTNGYDLSIICRSLLKDYQRRAAGRGEEGEQRVLSSARARAADAQAEERMLRVGILRGEYVPIVAVRKAWSAIAASFRECALSVAGKIADRMATVQSREEAFEIIDGEMCELLETLSGGGDIAAEDVGEVRDGQRARAGRNDHAENWTGDARDRAGHGVDRVMPGLQRARAVPNAEYDRSSGKRSLGFFCENRSAGPLSIG